MKVTKQGKLPGNKKYIGTCRKCKQEMSAQENELRNIARGNEAVCWAADCSLCNTLTYFKPWDTEEITKAYYEK